MRNLTPQLHELYVLVFLLWMGFSFYGGSNVTVAQVEVEVEVEVVEAGVILDLDTPLGKMSHTCMSMALSDFYAMDHNNNYTTRLSLHIRNSKSNIVEAASAGI